MRVGDQQRDRDEGRHGNRHAHQWPSHPAREPIFALREPEECASQAHEDPSQVQELEGSDALGAL